MGTNELKKEYFLENYTWSKILQHECYVPIQIFRIPEILRVPENLFIMHLQPCKTAIPNTQIICESCKFFIKCGISVKIMTFFRHSCSIGFQKKESKSSQISVILQLLPPPHCLFLIIATIEN